MRISLDIPPGLHGDDTSFSASPRWLDGSNVRFRLGRPQTIGGWESLVGTTLAGICRNVFPWTDNSGVSNIGFGTNSTLSVWQGGVLYDIKPTKALPSVTLGSAPVATTNGSTTVVMTQAGHPYIVGDSIVISGALSVATVTINGTWTIAAVTPDAWSFVANSAANSTATGGGSATMVTPQKAFTAGAVDGTGGAGYGMGAYSTGSYSEPSTADYFPRTWSLSAWGQNLIASHRDGTIHAWTNATGMPAAPISNAPARVTASGVAPQRQLFAFGCNQEVSGVFNPVCIRHSSIGDNTVWNTGSATTAQEYILPGGGRIVSARLIGNYWLVWTDAALFLGTFVGSITQPWRFDRLGDHCGLIGPNAAVVVGQSAYWIGPELQFYSYPLGGAPQPIICPVRETLLDNLAPSQFDKIVASSISQFSEVRFDYPDVRDGYENSRYLALCVAGDDAGAWHKGIMARTAFVDAGPTAFPLGVDPSGQIYWHERGQSADGASFEWFIESSDQYLDENSTALARCLWPDTAGQVGPVILNIFCRFKPQGEERAYGPFAMAPGQDRVDLRSSGRLFRIRFSGGSAPTACRIGKPIFEIASAGNR